jgi:hypothetical protein
MSKYPPITLELCKSLGISENFYNKLILAIEDESLDNNIPWGYTASVLMDVEDYREVNDTEGNRKIRRLKFLEVYGIGGKMSKVDKIVAQVYK